MDNKTTNEQINGGVDVGWLDDDDDDAASRIVVEREKIIERPTP
jgi:hypothetical protein